MAIPKKTISVFVALALVGALLGTWVISAQTTSGLSIRLKETVLIPFSILTIPGKGFDPSAAVSAVFSTKSGRIITIPAIHVTSNAIDVPVPPAAYSQTENTFTLENATLKVIQAKDRGDKLSVSTSNELTGLLIAYARRPALFDKDIARRLPKGALSRSFIAAALESLEANLKRIPAEKQQLRASFAEAQSGLTQLLDAAKQVVLDPQAAVVLRTQTGTTTIGSDEFSKLDALVAAFLGQLEHRRLVTAGGDDSVAFISAAQAAEETACRRNMQGEDPELAKLLEEPCRFRESAARQARKAGEALPEAAKFVYSLPLVMSSISLGYLLHEAALSTAAQMALSASFSFVTETLIDGKIAVTNAATAIAKAVVDHRLGVPLLEVGIPSAKLFYEIHEALPELHVKKPKTQPQAILPTTASTSQNAQLFQIGPQGARVSGFAIPAANKSIVINREAAFPPLAPAPPPPRPTPTPKPSPTPREELTVGGAVSSLACHFVGKGSALDRADYWKAEIRGTATGPDGTRVEYATVSCKEWGKDCFRDAGEPATTSWSVDTQVTVSWDGWELDGVLSGGSDPIAVRKGSSKKVLVGAREKLCPRDESGTLAPI